MNIRVKQAVKGVVVIKSGKKIWYKSKREFLLGHRIMLHNINAKLDLADTTEIIVSID